MVTISTNLQLDIKQNLEITRQRTFITHDYRSQKQIRIEYSILSHSEDELKNVLIRSSTFYPNLKIRDNAGNLLPIKSFKNVIDLLNFHHKNSNDKAYKKQLGEIIIKLKKRKTFLIWVQIPYLKTNQSTNIFLEFDPKFIKSKKIKIEIDISPKPYKFYLTLYSPKDFKLKIDKSTNKITNYKTNNSRVFEIEPMEKIKNNTLAYSFRPTLESSIAAYIALATLISIGSIMIIINLINTPETLIYQNILKKHVEIGGAIVFASLVVPQLVKNTSIHMFQRYLYLIPIVLGSLVIFWEILPR